MNKYPLILSLLFIVNTSNVWSQIYSWTDDNGKTHFGDKAPADKKADKIDPKKMNLMQSSINSESRRKSPAEEFKKDTFQMPLRKSDISHRFVMTTSLVDNNPIDRIDSTDISIRNKKFIIHVKFIGVEKFKKYNFRSRIIDSKGELIFNKVTPIQSSTSSMSFSITIQPNVNIDEPGIWTFQGILDNKTLFIEKRTINFPKRDHRPSIGIASAPAMIIMPDGTERVAPKSLEESMQSQVREYKRQAAIKKMQSNGGGMTHVIPPMGSADTKKTITMPDGSKRLLPEPGEEMRALMMEAKKQGEELQKQNNAARFLANSNQVSVKQALNTSRNLACPVKIDGICTGRMLKGADYSRMQIIRMAFTDANLEGADFSGSTIGSDTSFAGANLKDADFSGVELNNVDFTEADLTGADFTNIRCHGCNFDKAILVGAVFSGDNITSISFKNSNLKEITFQKPMTHWISWDLRNAKNLDYDASGLTELTTNNKRGMMVSPKYTINGCDLGVENADCSGKDLSGHRFLAVDVKNVNFSGTNLKEADLSAAHFISAQFDSANLSNAILPKLDRAKVNEVSFKKANLQGVTFTGNYVKGDFSNADLSNADLSGKDARSAKFENTSLSNITIKRTKFNILNLQKANIDNCEECKKLIASAKIDIEKLKDYISQSQDKQMLVDLARSDREAYKEYAASQYKARRDLAVLMEGQGIIDEKDLVSLIVKMLSTDNPSFYKQAFKIIDRTDQERYRAAEIEKKVIKSFCADSSVSRLAVSLLNYSLPEPKERSARSRRSISGKSVREAAIICLLSSEFKKKPNIHQALIDSYTTEENTRNKNLLLRTLTENRRDLSEPLLIQAVKEGDENASRTAAHLLSNWRFPPASLLPWLVKQFKGKRRPGREWSKLLNNYDVMAVAYLPELEGYYQELKDAYREKYNKTLHEHEWHNILLSDLRAKAEFRKVIVAEHKLKQYDKQSVFGSYLPSEKTVLDFGIKYTETASHFSMLKIKSSEINEGLFSSLFNTIKKWFKLFKGFFGVTEELDTTNPFYSDDADAVRRLLSYYKLPEDAQSIESVSGVEYVFYEHQYGEPIYLGVDTFLFKTDQEALSFGQLLIDQKQPRRRIINTGRLIYSVWRDPSASRPFSAIYKSILDVSARHPELVEK